MKKLNAMDQAFLMLETEQRPMNIGALLQLAPPPGLRGDFARHVVEAMLERPVGPPFNQRLVAGPGRLGLGFAVDENIDAASRIHFHTLGTPGDRHALFKAVCAIHEQHLDRAEPLWQMHVFKGLPEGRIALYFKTHHALIDGIGFLHVFERVVTASQTEERTHAIWEGFGNDRLPVKRTASQDPLARLIGAAIDTAGNAIGFGAMTARMLMRGAGGGVGLSLPFINTPHALKAAPSSHRVLGHCVLDLPTVRRVAKQGGGTVNDVLLTTLDIAISRYSSEHDDAPDRPLIVDMPVALSKDAGTGNRVAILQLPLGTPGASAARRFADIRRETGRIKEEVRSAPGSVLELYTVLTHSAASLIETFRLGQLPMLANAVVSNPYGMTKPVFYNRCPVELALPLSVVAHHQTVNITATTYVDGLNVTFIATREAMPDVQQVADYTVEALAELAVDLGVHDASTGSTNKPHGSRAEDRKQKRARTKTGAKAKASAKSTSKPTARTRRKAGT